MDQESFDRRVRLWIYRHAIDTGSLPGPLDIAEAFVRPLGEVEASLRRLAGEADALVLLPGSSSIWMAEPFSAVPTSFRVRAGNRRWWGNCIWDGLAILAVLALDGAVETACPNSGSPLRVTVERGALSDAPGVVHFAVPAAEWWRDIGFT